MIERRVLIVGAGAMGGRHAAAVHGAGDRVSAVVDPDASRATRLAPDARHFASLDAALGAGELFDTAVIATPSADHLDQATTLVSAGCSVLVEKPHRVPGQAVDGLAGALGRAGSLFVGMSTRHWPGMHEVTAAVVSGELGEILSYTDRVGFRLGGDSLPPWYFERETLGGGVLLTNGVHALDRARAMLGGLSLVSARLTRVFPDHDCDDIAELRLETSSGAPVGLSIMWLPYQPTATGITVVGTAGTASVAMDGSWSVTTTTGVRTGAAIDLDTVPFEAQWAAFVAAQPGFGLGDLEPTLATIDEIYEGASRD